MGHGVGLKKDRGGRGSKGRGLKKYDKKDLRFVRGGFSIVVSAVLADLI